MGKAEIYGYDKLSVNVLSIFPVVNLENGSFDQLHMLLYCMY